jgi:hypothetical protein
VRATDPGLADPASWRVSHDGGVVIVARGPAGDQDADGTGAGPADLELSGPAARLLLLLVRRASVAQATDGPDPVTVRGDQALLTQWLAETIF